MVVRSMAFGLSNASCTIYILRPTPPQKKSPLEGCVPTIFMAYLLLFPPFPPMPVKNKAGRVLPTSMAQGTPTTKLHCPPHVTQFPSSYPSLPTTSLPYSPPQNKKPAVSPHCHLWESLGYPGSPRELEEGEGEVRLPIPDDPPWLASPAR